MPEEAQTLPNYFKLILTLRMTQEVDCRFTLTYFHAFWLTGQLHVVIVYNLTVHAGHEPGWNTDRCSHHSEL